MRDETNYNGIAKVVDVFFNRRPAEPDPEVTIHELVKRGTSVVRVGRKLYRVVCTEVEVTK